MSNRGLAGSREPKGSDEIVSQTLRVTKELRIDLAAGVEELEAGPKGPRWETHIPTQPPYLPVIIANMTCIRSQPLASKLVN